MDTTGFEVRRATLNDLDALRELWSTEKLPVEILENRFTEFQVALNPSGELVAALGLQNSGKEARIHSEAYRFYDQRSFLLPLFWNRVHNVAKNTGVVRVWTAPDPFWEEQGFRDAPDQELSNLPNAFGQGPQGWLVLKLREDIDKILSSDHEFEIFQTAQKEERDRLMQQAKVMKTGALLFACVVFIIIMVGTFFLFRNRDRLRQGNPNAPSNVQQSIPVQDDAPAVGPAPPPAPPVSENAPPPPPPPGSNF